MDEQRDQENCYQVCKSLLGGRWTSITSKDDLVIRRIEEGMSNRLYVVHLKSILKPSSSDKVVVRFYGSSLMTQGVHAESKAKSEQIEAEMMTKLALLSLGPELLTTFPGGRIESFISGNSLTDAQVAQDSPVHLLVAEKIAIIHSLNDVPVKQRNPLFSFKFYDTYCEHYYQSEETKSEEMDQDDREIAEYFSQIDFSLERQFLNNIFTQMKSRVVFSHNDMHYNNVTVLNEPLKDDINCNSFEGELGNNILVHDFEYANNNYRWADISNYFCEMQFLAYNSNKRRGEEIPPPPDSNFKRNFIEVYLKQWVPPSGQVNPEIDNVEHVMEEVNFGCLLVNIMRVLFFLGYVRKNCGRFQNWSYTKCRFEAYLKLKEEMNSCDKNGN